MYVSIMDFAMPVIVLNLLNKLKVVEHDENKYGRMMELIVKSVEICHIDKNDYDTCFKECWNIQTNNPDTYELSVSDKQIVFINNETISREFKKGCCNRPYLEPSKNVRICYLNLYDGTTLALTLDKSHKWRVTN